MFKCASAAAGAQLGHVYCVESHGILWNSTMLVAGLSWSEPGKYEDILNGLKVGWKEKDGSKSTASVQHLC